MARYQLEQEQEPEQARYAYPTTNILGSLEGRRANISLESGQKAPEVLTSSALQGILGIIYLLGTLPLAFLGP
jgi:hypothetical protein